MKKQQLLQISFYVIVKLNQYLDAGRICHINDLALYPDIIMTEQF